MALKDWMLAKVARRLDPQLWERIDGHPKPIMDVTLLGERRRSIDAAGAAISETLFGGRN